VLALSGAWRSALAQNFVHTLRDNCRAIRPTIVADVVLVFLINRTASRRALESRPANFRQSSPRELAGEKFLYLARDFARSL
jgi:hypothetical protein